MNYSILASSVAVFISQTLSPLIESVIKLDLVSTHTPHDITPQYGVIALSMDDGISASS